MKRHNFLIHAKAFFGERAVVAVLVYLPSIPAVGPDIFLLYAQDFSSVHSLWLKVRKQLQSPSPLPKIMLQSHSHFSW